MAPHLMEEPGEHLTEGQKVLFICVSFGLVIMAGLMSGLTIGLMAMDEIEMEVRTCLQLACSLPPGIDFHSLRACRSYRPSVVPTPKHVPKTPWLFMV